MSDDHYFTADPSAPFKRETFTASVWGHELALTSGAGVYSRGHLDHATDLLLRAIEPPPPGHLLDLGCGYGVIGLALAEGRPARERHRRRRQRARDPARQRERPRRSTWRAGSSRAARTRSRRTRRTTRSGRTRRSGSARQALHELLLTWLPRLRPSGRAVMVVGKHLGADSLQRWLSDQGWPTTRLASAKGFRVLETPAAHAQQV